MEKKFLIKIEKYLEKYIFGITTCLSISFFVLHRFDFIENLRNITGSIIGFASIVIALHGLSLSVLISFADKPIIKRIETLDAGIIKKIIIEIKKQINFSLIVVGCSVLIGLLPSPSIKALSSFGAGFWFWFLLRMTHGVFIMISLMVGLISKNQDSHKRNIRK